MDKPALEALIDQTRAKMKKAAADLDFIEAARLREGEANLPKQSVVLVSRTLKVDTAQLGGTIGTLKEGRIAQILAGIRLLQFMTQHHK